MSALLLSPEALAKQYKAAVAQARIDAKSIPTGYMKVEINLNYASLILTHKKGLELLAALEGAELYDRNYGAKPSLKPLGGEVATVFFPQTEYELVRTAILLNMGLDDLRQAMQ